MKEAWYDPAGYAVELRDTLGWVLSTRHTWGRWHHERDTAAGLRALLTLGHPPQDASGTVTVLLDGKPLREVTIDPANPYLSTLTLARLDLPPLAPGTHTVEVRSTSRLPATAALHIETALLTKQHRADSKHTQLTVAAPVDVSVGQRAAMTVQARRTAGAKLPMQIAIATSGLVEPDLVAITRALADNPAVARTHIGPDALRVELAHEADALDLTLPVSFPREGAGAWPAVSLTHQDATIAATAGPLTIAP
jgi:hypothetical protein